MAKRDKTPGDFEVGRGKPPAHTRFKPGQSGNPGGKRKGDSLTRRIAAILARETIGGRPISGGRCIADLLAEVRDYGEGLIIVDQIPGKLIPDVLKNTNIKVVHRILARDDQDALAGSMGMTETQRGILTQLQKGEAVVQNANRVSLVKIHQAKDVLI